MFNWAHIWSKFYLFILKHNNRVRDWLIKSCKTRTTLMNNGSWTVATSVFISDAGGCTTDWRGSMNVLSKLARWKLQSTWSQIDDCSECVTEQWSSSIPFWRCVLTSNHKSDMSLAILNCVSLWVFRSNQQWPYFT